MSDSANASAMRDSALALALTTRLRDYARYSASVRWREILKRAFIATHILTAEEYSAYLLDVAR